MAVLDIVMLCVLGFCLWEGYRKGMVWSIFHLTSYFLSLYLTKVYHSKFSTWILQQTGIVTWISNGVEKKFNDLFTDYFLSVTEGSQFTGTGWGLVGEYLIKETSVQEYAHNTIETFKSTMVQELTHSIVNFLSLILLFFILRIAFSFLSQVLSRIFSLPVLDTFNQAGGALVGVLKGGVLVVVGTAVMVFLAMISPQGWSAGLLEKSMGAQWVIHFIFPLFL